MNRDKYLKSWLRALKGYEKISYNILIKYFKREIKNIPWAIVDDSNYIEVINTSVKVDNLFSIYYNIYSRIGETHGKRVGKGINRDLKEFSDFAFLNDFRRGLVDWVLENVGFRIVSVHDTYKKHIADLIADGIKRELTIIEISKEIEKLVNKRNFYRWQALRIARTETAAAANRGAIEAGNSSSTVYEKIWISSNNERTRTSPPNKYDHRVMDGVKVDKEGFFNVQGELLEYPAAPLTKEGKRSNGGAVINCVCAVALVPKRDSNGRLVRV